MEKLVGRQLYEVFAKKLLKLKKTETKQRQRYIKYLPEKNIMTTLGNNACYMY